ncbi:MAG: energy-coupling factor ABC transporter permease [Candidatus Lokiarchaeota archaeon]|nr:energy-coupling factor ABC transporter permease [Candidatus Lokiarchaeota archaeon]
MIIIHINDGILAPIPIGVLWIITILTITFGYFKIRKLFNSEDYEKFIPYIGVLAAVIFAFQYVNYPIIGGSSGHLIGGTLVAVILGPWASVLVLFLVLMVQSLFGDGGLLALGANTFNMGIICGIIGFFIVVGIKRLLDRTKIQNTYNIIVSTAIGSYIALLIASIACGIQLVISGIGTFEFVIPAMLFWYSLIGIGEAVISALIIFYILKTKPNFIMTQKFLRIF